MAPLVLFFKGVKIKYHVFSPFFGGYMDLRLFLKILKLLEKAEKLIPKNEKELDSYPVIKPLLIQLRSVVGQPELPLKGAK